MPARAEPKPFEALRILREFQREHFPYLETAQDFDILREIGLREEAGRPITIGELMLADVGSVSTVQRRLAMLKAAGAVEQKRLPRDHRAFHLVLGRKTLQSFTQYHRLLAQVGKRSR